VTTLLLVRHGLTKMTGPVLAGWTPGVHLDDRGQEQARALAERLSKVPVAGIVASPLERCQETASALAGGRDLAVVTDERLGECRYGDWTGQELKKLVKDPMWKVVQAHPSAASFPGGETLRETQARAIAAIRDHNAELGADATWIAVTHGDVVKAVLADALGMHLDMFQRILVDPASVSVVRYTDLRPFVVRMNDSGGAVDDLLPPKSGRRRRKASSDAVVGGGAGTDPHKVG
jgi:probable phosphomutase (TIGR03848 family)